MKKIWYYRLLSFMLLLTFLLPMVFSHSNSVQAAPSLPTENNGLATAPLLGWSSWSSIRHNPNQDNIEAQALAMATTLKSHGYQYINLDDFWYPNPSTTVDQFGRWVVDSSRFPNGLASVATYIHSLGLKFGLYVTPGIPVAAVNQNTPIEGTTFHARDIADTSRHEANYQFGGNVMYYIDYSKPGAQAYINSWANQFASWGVDFLKIDGVGSGDIPDIQAWSTALKQSGRPIYFHLSNSLDINNVSTWQQNANGWRISGDIECNCSGLVNWNTVSSRFSIAPAWASHASPGGWNDFDSLDVGNGNLDGLTNDERQTYMTLWAASAAPLYSGDDLTSLDSFGTSLLTNDEVIAINQAGHPIHPVSQSSSQQTWFVNNGDGTYTVALFNLGNSTATVTVNWNSLGIAGSAPVHDVWSHSDLGNFTGSFSATLASHASRLLKISSKNLVSSNGNGGSTLQTGSLPGSQLDVFALGADNNVWDLYKTGDSNSPWSTWGSHGNPGVQMSALTTGTFSDGRLNLFATGSDGNVWNTYKLTTAAGSPWSSWVSLGHAGTGLTGQVQVNTLPDGRLNLFVLGNDGNVWNLFKTTPDTGSLWSGWASLGNPGVQMSALTTGTFSDGRLNLFATGSDGNVWNLFKLTTAAGSPWSSWASLGIAGNGLKGQVQVAALPDGRLQLFAIGADNNVWSNFKTTANTGSLWSGWTSLGNPGIQLSKLTVGTFSDGRINLFATASDGKVWNLFKLTGDPGSAWSTWSSLGQVGTGLTSQVQVGTLADGRLYLFVIGPDNSLWGNFKISTDTGSLWSGWNSLGQPVGSGGFIQ